MKYFGVYIERGYVNSSDKNLAIKYLIKKCIPTKKVFLKEDLLDFKKDIQKLKKLMDEKLKKEFKKFKMNLKRQFKLEMKMQIDAKEKKFFILIVCLFFFFFLNN